MKKAQIYSSFAALLLLAGCGAGNFWDNFTGEREPQKVSGARRVPTLNAQGANSQSSASVVSAPLAPMVTTTAATATNPYDNYDANGNPVGTVAEKIPASDVNPPVRKPFAGNLSPLTTVPEKPKEFDAVKASAKPILDDLQSNHAVADKNKLALDADIATEKMSPVATPSANIKPLLSSPPPAPSAPPPAPQTLQLPANVAPQSNVVSVSVPVPVVSLPEIKVDAPVPPFVDTNVVSAAPQAQAEDALPSPEIVKTMPPSRYSSRVQQ